MATQGSDRRSSSGRTGSSSGVLYLTYGIFGVGIVLIVLAILTQVLGSTVTEQSLHPDPDGEGTIYVSSPITLAQGRYDLRLHMEGVAKVVGIGFPYTITAREHHEWLYTGLVQSRRPRKTTSPTGSRLRSSGSRLVEVREPGQYTLEIRFDARLVRSLDLKMISVVADYRLPLYVGLGLVVLGALMNEKLRRAVSILKRLRVFRAGR